MQYKLTDLINKEHIVVNLQAKDSREVIDLMTVPLVNTGHVSPEFAEDVWNRELVYPTGLPTEPFAVAIPHADPDHINQSAVCIGILKTPVQFGQMGTDGSTKLDAHLIFLLALKEREKQVEMISQLIHLIQTGSLLEELSLAQDEITCVELIERTLKENK
jgi:PTS system galactitol-specific IIA component